ncbi:hypothetical protein DEU56DRAFT_897582 [Suillus clintonianus]|uniref:uncharacterized protein n=1 Tax=Suillus clintonianus TaxID=1904413 RepID=UPI001B874910|nr:uncharacterized protein DEU56DRAFT_897582 [Suillus clintonianus]KAG2155662.1 hypothetical protein DEU56DRAFT_897582 [Suillus clintonianus]
MKYSKSFTAMVAAGLVRVSLAQSTTWCGKNYMANQSVVPPGGQFVLPIQSAEPLLSFRCAPVFRPYLEEDAKSAAFVVDTPIVYDWITGAESISLPSNSSNSSGSTGLGSLSVTISVGSVYTTTNVPLNATGIQIPVDISNLDAQKTAYNVSCSAVYSAPSSSGSETANEQKFSASSSLLYLPNTNASVTKTDLRTGALWVRPASGNGGTFAPFIPQGFYINFDQYLAKNLSMIDQLKADGFNTLHPIPPYDNLTIFEEVINKTVSAGMYIVYDMRSNYQNLTAVAQQVNTYASIPNLLNWETAHEPDGNSDPQNAAQAAYDLIYQMDGYHPVSIVLNCQDYNFSPYVGGADIVLQDAYPIGINATWSPVWNTECTPDFGHCGCDNCQGEMWDVKARVQTFKNRLNILGFDRTKSVWTTPQAFGSAAYWNTTPTGMQWAAMGFTSFSHGAIGSKSYQYPTTTNNETTIEGTAAGLTVLIQKYVQPFMVDPNATFASYDYQGVDAGLWNNGTSYLLLVVNMGNAQVYMPYQDIGLGWVTNATKQVQRIFSVFEVPTAAGNLTGVTFQAGGIGIHIATP